ncbi:MAG: phenylacetate--CoA ligase family protein [Jatrophihabitans sp.]
MWPDASASGHIVNARPNQYREAYVVFDSAIDQLRYVTSVLLNRPASPTVLSRIARDMVMTMDEFGAPGEDAQLLPGQSGGVDPEVRRTMTSRNLRATARWAQTTSYYRQVFADTGLSGDRFDLANWTQIPVTPKAALKAMPAAFVSTRVNPAIQARTTGTTGAPAVIWFSRDEFETMAALSTLGATMQEELRREHVVAFAGCSRNTMALTLSMESATRIGAAFVQYGMVEPALVLDALANPVGLPGKLAQISHLICSSSYLAALVQLAEDEGWRPADFGLQSIDVGGEVLTAALGNRALAALGARPRSAYLMTEALPYGAALCQQGHLHFTSELAHVEFLDPQTYQPARPGELATIVITPLYPYRRCTMLLRYVTGDLVRLPVEQPSCELAQLPATSDILGRYTGPGSVRVLTRPLLEALERHPSIPLPARYTVTGEQQLSLHVLSRSDAEPLRRSILDSLTAAGVPITDVILHTGQDGMPAAMPVRADLRERTFEGTGTKLDLPVPV